MKNDNYGIDQIQVLHGLEPVRMRPGMYIGSTSQSGIDQLIYEIVDNSVDEHTSGFGDIIDVHIYKDGRVIVSDKGRGIPCEVSDKFKDDNGNILNSLTGIMTTLHAGGKFGASGGYKNSSGLHGVGGACVNALSDSFIVTVHRDGNIYQQNFSKGKPTSDVDIIGHCDDTGTIVEYIPDKTIFKQTILPSERVAKRLRELAFLNKGLHIHYINDVSLIDEEYYFENGILGYVNQMVANKPKLYDEPFYIMDNWMDADGHNVICELAFINTDEEESVTKIKAFANNINNYEGGFHLQGFKNAYKDIVNQYALDKKTIKTPIEMQYVLDGVYAIVNVKIYNPEFEGQTKNKLGNKEAQDAVEAVMKEFFAKALRKRSVQQCFDIIVNRAVKVKESELAARKARALSRKLKKTTMLARPEKLADCSNRIGYNEIYLVEGDSAAGGLKNARDTRYQAILPLRGKLLNTGSADIEKVFNSDTVNRIVAALGTSAGKNFNIDDLRYDKILIACFVGDTKVKLLDGRIMSIKEMAEQDNKQSQDWWVYSVDTDGSFIPAKAIKPRITKYVSDTVKLTLDDGTTIECTPEHKFMLKDGSYCEAQNLTPEMSLMSLYTKPSSDTSILGGREMLYNNGRYEYTYRLVKKYIDPLEDYHNMCIHHKDHNGHNNNPDNLQWMTEIEHNHYHMMTYNTSKEHSERIKQLHRDGVYKHCSWQYTYNGSQAQKDMLHELNKRPDILEYKRNAMTKYNQSEQHKETVRNMNRDVSMRFLQLRGKILVPLACLVRKGITLTEDVFTGKYKNIVYGLVSREYMKQIFNSVEDCFKAAIEYEQYELTDEQFNSRTDMNEIKKHFKRGAQLKILNQMAGIGKKVLESGQELNETNYIAKKKECKSRAAHYKNWSLYFNTEAEFIEYCRNYNHKMVSIEYVHYDAPIPVYCMTVESTHNFSLWCENSKSLLPVHNCDADLDALHIIVLILTLFYYHMRGLIEQGKVYIVVSPLYRLHMKDNTFKYIKDDAELKEFKKKHPNAKYEVKRYKGLGCMSEEDTRSTLMDPRTRVLKKVVMHDAEQAAKSFDILMGKNANLRKMFIQEHSNEIDITSFD